MTKYRFTYFNFSGRGEVSRLLFSLAGVEFEDVRIDLEEEWPRVKPTTPFGRMPVLEIDDKLVLTQSFAINTYLAKTFGYAAKTDQEQAKVDMVFGCVDDMIQPIGMGKLRAADVQTKAAIVKEFVEEEFPFYMSRFEKMLSENDSRSGYFVGETITVADLALAARLTAIGSRLGTELDLSNYPRCAALRDLVYKHPKIAAWKAKGHQEM